MVNQNTSGVIIIAKDDDSHNKLSFQFSNREVKKVYRAIVWGRINNQGKIEGYLTRDSKNRTCFVLNDLFLVIFETAIIDRHVLFLSHCILSMQRYIF